MEKIDALKDVFSGNTEDKVLQLIFNNIVQISIEELSRNNESLWRPKISSHEVYKEVVSKLTTSRKIDFIEYLVKNILEYHKDLKSGVSNNLTHHHRKNVQEAYLKQIFRAQLVMTDKEFRRLYTVFLNNTIPSYFSILYWPIAPMLSQLERQYKDLVLNEDLLNILKDLRNELQSLANVITNSNRQECLERIDRLLFKEEKNILAIRPTFFLGKDTFSEYANGCIEKMDATYRDQWYLLNAHAQTAGSGKPSQKFLKNAGELIDSLGADRFCAVLKDWIEYLINTLDQVVGNRANNYSYTYYNFLDFSKLDNIKGFIWMCSHVKEPEILLSLSRLVEKSYSNLPGQGPIAMALGNACIYALAKAKEFSGIGQLSRLKFRIKQNTAHKLIEKYLEEAANEKGVSKYEIEDAAVVDYGLIDGKKEIHFGDYKAILSIVGVGKTDIEWYKPNGEPQKTVPSLVKEQFSKEWDSLRKTIKEIEKTLVSQRDRLDRMFRVNRSMSWDYFQNKLFNHGLLGYLYQKIIWQFNSNDNTQNGLWMEGRWFSADNHSFIPNEQSTITLWHPASESVESVRSWRLFLQLKQIQQPLKQAFREIYLLTEAERNTQSFSNRMATHILKQHQFNSLAKLRGWKYKPMGDLNDSQEDESVSSLELSELNLRVEYSVHKISEERAYSHSAFWNYIATSQIRFINTATQDSIDLIDVPLVLFSEVMRDIDLFVGVASVGNDPKWQNSVRSANHREYWQAYSFGDLSEIANSRKDILIRLLPCLKINTVAEIKDKFLIIKGKLRTYKIHIGSTNILMEPNDQYLCIVPDQSKKVKTPNVFLPFEADNGLSIVLSKAFLLAEDYKIRDKLIVSQINI